MKRIIGLAIGCLLGGCETGPDNRQKSTLMIQNSIIQEKIFRQDTAPLPCVHVLPSERAAHFLDADFDYIARRIRHAMTINLEKFRDVRLVLVDYAVLEPKPITTKLMNKKYKGQTYCKEYISKPERYFMRISFYRENQQPPAPPLFVGAAVLAIRHAAPFEAMHFLVDDIIDEHLKLPFNQVEVNLDAAEDIEKNLHEIATAPVKTNKTSSHPEVSLPSPKTTALHKGASAATPKPSLEIPAAPPSAPATTAPTPPPPGAVPAPQGAVPTPPSPEAVPSPQGTSTGAVPTPPPSEAAPSSQGTSSTAAAPTPPS